MTNIDNIFGLPKLTDVLMNNGSFDPRLDTADVNMVVHEEVITHLNLPIDRAAKVITELPKGHLFSVTVRKFAGVTDGKDIRVPYAFQIFRNR